MEYKVLYRKYRPDCFKNIIGQDYTIKMLQNAIIHDKISHAYLFTGPRGTGKTSTAKVFAKTINCLNVQNGEACGTCANCLAFDSSPDIIEIDAASNNGVDDIRELINNVKIAPTDGKYKIYIIDEVHMMTSSAFNALLLTLEEPPSHAVFIMATTNVESVPITILSRCQRFNFKKFSLEDLVSQITYVCKEENIEIDDDAVTEIAYLSEGGMRDALSLLDQLAANGEKITIDKILSNYGSISTKFVNDLIVAIDNCDLQKVCDALEELQNTSSDYKIFIKKLIKELAHFAVKIKEESVSTRLLYKDIKNMIFELNECMNSININVNPYLLIEMLLLNYIGETNTEKNIDFSEQPKKVVEVNDARSKDDVFKERVLSEQNGEKSLSLVNSNTYKVNDDYLVKLKKIRINNCFVNAKKSVLIDYKKYFQEMRDDTNTDPELLSLLIDSDIVAASLDHVILASALPSTVLLINQKLDELKDEFLKKAKINVKFICLTTDEWNKEKKIYVENLKANVTYKMVEEDTENDEKEVFIDNNNVSSLDKIATNVFNSDKIEEV